MSLRDLWAKNPENKRILRPKSYLGDMDDLVTRINEGVFAKINSSLDKKLDEIAKSVSSVCEKVKAVERRVEDAEQRISDTEDTVSQLLVNLTTPRHGSARPLTGWKTKRTGPDVITLKSSTCQNAQRVPMLKTSSAKGSKPQGEERLDQDGQVSPHPSTDMAKVHQTKGCIRLNNYADKQLGEIKESGNRIHLFEDFSPAVEKKRHEFLEAKKPLQALEIPYRMLFPAVLRTAHDNKVQLFKTAAEAQRYIEALQEDKT